MIDALIKAGYGNKEYVRFHCTVKDYFIMRAFDLRNYLNSKT
jgi:hypothetical protein